jgi:hypothetical protein
LDTGDTFALLGWCQEKTGEPPLGLFTGFLYIRCV